MIELGLQTHRKGGKKEKGVVCGCGQPAARSGVSIAVNPTPSIGCQYDAFICLARPVYMCTRIIPMCDMTHSYVQHDAFMCVT